MRLNRTQLIISGILLVSALILALCWSRKPDPLGPVSQQPSIRELVARPVNIKPALEKLGTAVPAACPELWTRVAASAAEQFKNFSEADKEAMKSCSDAVPLFGSHDPEHLSKLRASCSTPDEEGSDAMQSNCALYFYFYKAGLVAYLNADKAPQDLGTDELALLFFHEYYNLDNKKLERVAQLADELVARNPSYSTRKARASLQLFQFMNDGSRARADELIGTLQELKNRNPDDEQLHEMHFVVLAMLKDQTRMNELTESYIKAHPSSALGYYIRSAYFWQIKDRDRTIELLKNAIALEPGNPRFMETRDRVETAEPGSNGVYNVNVNFDLIQN